MTDESDKPQGFNDDWKRFFDHHAPQYMKNVFTEGTIAEVDFAIRELGVEPPARLLDMGCGTGRHSVELAKRGYVMTGVDLSDGMLDEARRAAEQAGVEIEFIQADATMVTLEPIHDGALCVCEGAFGLLGTGDDPTRQALAILRNINAALKPGGRLLLTALNGLKMARQYGPEDVDKGVFDPLILVETHSMEVEGTGESVIVREKGYTGLELTSLLERAGFDVEHIGGGTAGRWSRRSLDMDEYELMAIACKTDG